MAKIPDSVPMQKQYKAAFIKFCAHKTPRMRHVWKWDALLKATSDIRNALSHMEKEKTIDLRFMINLSYDNPEKDKVIMYTLQRFEHNIRIVDVERGVENNKRQITVMSDTHSDAIIKAVQKLIGQQAMPLSTSTIRSRNRRERFKEQGLVELRGIWLTPEQRTKVEAYVERLKKDD